MSRNPWRRGPTRVVAITGARPGLTQDVRGRQRRYITAMLVRTACVVLMAATWNRWPALAVLALAGGIAIPYVAVVAAGAGWSRQRGARPAPRGNPEQPASPVPLEPTLILPPEHRTAR